MSRVRYSSRTEADYLEIGSHTQTTWGDVQADRYLTKPDQSFEDLAEHSDLGRLWTGSEAGVRRYSVASHVVFYAVEHDGTLVLRTLHKSMNAEMQVI